MTIPFLSYFKRGKTNETLVEKPAVAAKPTPAPVEKPSSERFKKTVMPSSTRTTAPQDPFEMASRSTALGGAMPSIAVPAPTGQRTVAFSGSSPKRSLPAAVALALEPTVERVISIELSDVLTEMPEGYCKPIEAIDTTRRVLLKASEVEKGMASGKPSVSLLTVYQQVPEIFIRRIADSDETQLSLPFRQVLEAFAKMQVRGDQERASAVPQVETPFLKVTLEDNQAFGIEVEPLETTDLPPVHVEPATAEAFAAAEPEGFGDTIVRISPPPSSNGHAPESPKRIPFKLSPNGTGAPATESVPASSGPSVPNLPSPPAPVSATPTPLRIPFKMAPSPRIDEEEAKPKPEPWMTKESLAQAEAPVQPTIVAPVMAEAPRPAEVKIKLPLLPILKSLPPMQLTSDPGSVPPDVKLELPFALIEPQLASGRVSVTAKVFEVSLPISFRGLFQAGPGAVDVALPLQEVLKNLPATSLRMRDDQVEQDAGQNFATPFSAKAEEDAKRFNIPAAPVAKPSVPEPVEAPKETSVVAGPSSASDAAKQTPVVAGVSPVLEAKEQAADPAGATEDKPSEKASDRPLRSPLQVALGTDEKLDAKGVIALLNKMPGVRASAIHFGDGLLLAGSLPPELETEGICAMAPSLMQRLENHLVDTKLGALRGMTLSCTKGAITFFMHENLCLAACHAEVDLPGETREKLSRVVHELSRKYSHPV